MVVLWDALSVPVASEGSLLEKSRTKMPSVLNLTGEKAPSLYSFLGVWRLTT